MGLSPNKEPGRLQVAFSVWQRHHTMHAGHRHICSSPGFLTVRFRFNYRGRICLAASLVFGFFSLLIVLFLQPLIFGGLEMLTEATLLDAASFLVICYATDVVATTLSLDARARERVLGVARRIRDIT